MKEVHFIKQNKDRWESYKNTPANPDELANRFICLIDDLGYAKTHYPLSSIVTYLNDLASKLYLSIYRTKKSEKGWLKLKILEEIPLLIYKHRKILSFSLLLFFVFYLIGLFISTKDAMFVRAILSDEYVNMTQDNISKGKPFGVYGNSNQFVMFFQIAWNNIRVAFMTFVAGLIMMVGSIYFLFKNGIMVGAFHYMFIEHGFGWKWMLIVMIHGTFELFCIAIAGGCGLMLGNAFLFPKTYTRKTSLKYAVKDALQIMAVVLVLLVMAAIFESFVTRYEHMPIGWSIFILLTCFTTLTYYIIILPIKVHRKQQKEWKQLQQSFLQYHNNGYQFK
jgi:uncharacterized membrane protein SpoIIM required for sporulation